MSDFILSTRAALITAAIVTGSIAVPVLTLIVSS